MASTTRSLPIVSLVGHTEANLNRLCLLYLENKPEEPHFFHTVFNGDSVNWFLGGLTVPNDPAGRDIDMHNWAVKRAAYENMRPKFMVFFNDDVVHIADNRWLAEAAEAIEGCDNDLYGFQPNLGSMVDPTYAKRGGIRNISIFPQFVRTHAFACRLDWFEEHWKMAEGNAQKFEKQTLSEVSRRIALADDYTQIMDSNTYPHREEIRRWQRQTAQR